MKRPCIIVFWLLLCSTVMAELSTEMNNKAYLAEKEAMSFLNQGKYQEAIAKYTEVIEIISDNSDLYYNRAYCYEHLEQYDAAIADFEKAVQYNEHFSDAHYTLALLYYVKGNKDKALMHFGNIEGEKDRPENLLFIEAVVKIKKEAFDDALVLLKQCIELKIAVSKSYFYLGMIYFQQSSFELAVDYLKKANALKPYDAGSNLYLMLGVSQALLKQYKPAIISLNRYIPSGPPIAEAYFYRGLSQLRMRDFTYKMEPLDDFKKALELKPKSPDGAFGMACFHIVAKRYEAANILLDSLIKVDAGRPEFFIELGKAYAGLKRPDKAHEAFSTAKRLYEKQADAYLETGMLYLNQNKPEQALLELETAMRLDPTDKLITLYHARAIGLLGKAKEAQKTMEGLLALSYDDFGVYYKNLAHHFLGMMLLEQGKDDAGREHMEEAHFRLEEAGLFYGDWWLKQGDLKNALRIYHGSSLGSLFAGVELKCRIGDVFLKQKKYWDASYAYEDALKIIPRWPKRTWV